MPMPRSRTLPGLFEEMARAQPDAPFLTGGEARLSYAGFHAAARDVARGLHQAGVRRGDKVAILMGNRPEWLLTCFAATGLGATLVALNTWWKAAELHHALELTDASVLVMEGRSGSRDYTAELAKLGDLPAALPRLRRIVCLGGAMPAGAVPWEAMLADGAAVPDAALDEAAAGVRPDDMAYLLFTSGSTARSKAVPLLHRGLVENMYGIGERLHLSPDDRMLMVISLFWSFACANALVAVLTHGGSIVLQYRFDAGQALELIERERISVLYTMPNMVLDLYHHPDRPGRDLRSLRTGIGMPQSLPLMAELGATEMATCYGLTEGYGNSAVPDCKIPLADRLDSSGTALPGTELQVVDPATRAPLPAGTVGEIRLRGYVMPGYYKDPARTAEATDAEGWFYTGDLAALAPDGTVHFRGRTKEMVKTGGINVAPAEVEELLHSHPGVRLAVVVGIPDPQRDEVLAALVLPQPGASLSPDALRAYCKERAAVYKVPAVIEIVGEGGIPLTDTGKVSKRLVQERFMAGLSRSPAG